MTLILTEVSKRFGGVTALDSFSMSVPSSSITGLIGPNGAGKTTVVNLITGIYALSAGRITFGDRDVTSASAHEIGALGIARTFQNIRLLAEQTVLQNVLIGFHRQAKASLISDLLGLPRSRAETRAFTDRAHQLLQRMGMSRFANYPAKGLSYGHQRKVEIMRALASEPTLLLLDEPVAGMNAVEAGELGELFVSLAQDGVAILLIEHNIKFVRQLCQSAYVLDSGRSIARGTPVEVIADPAVIAAYLGG